MKRFADFLNSHIVTSVLLRALSASLDPRRQQDTNVSDQFLLSIIVHCAKDELQTRAMMDLDMAFQGQYDFQLHTAKLIRDMTAIVDADYTISKTAATACMTVSHLVLRDDFSDKGTATMAIWRSSLPGEKMDHLGRVVLERRSYYFRCLGSD